MFTWYKNLKLKEKIPNFLAELKTYFLCFLCSLYCLVLDPINLGRNCEDGTVVCSFGAECEQDGNRVGCVCNIQCDGLTSEENKGVNNSNKIFL